jgi:hypothetical protein
MPRTTITLLLVLSCVPFTRAEDKAQAIIEKAIEAQGGEDKVAKLRAMRVKVEGTLTLGEEVLSVTIEDTWAMPNRYKSASSYEYLGEKHLQIQTIDGDKGWIQTDGTTVDMPEDALKEMKEQKYAEDLDRLGFLKDKDIELATLEEIKVDDSPAVGVLVKRKGHRDVKLYFDKKSGLLVKRIHEVLNSFAGELVSQEVIFADYKEKDGVKCWHKITGYRLGEKFVEGKVKEIEFLNKIDDKTFAKP